MAAAQIFLSLLTAVAHVHTSREGGQGRGRGGKRETHRASRASVKGLERGEESGAVGDDDRSRDD